MLESGVAGFTINNTSPDNNTESVIDTDVAIFVPAVNVIVPI